MVFTRCVSTGINDEADPITAKERIGRIVRETGNPAHRHIKEEENTLGKH